MYVAKLMLLQYTVHWYNYSILNTSLCILHVMYEYA